MTALRGGSILKWGGGFVLFAGAVALAASGSRADWTFFASAFVAMVGAVWIGAAWMTSIDEAAQEAHKWAWYWGGSIGMALGGVLVVLSVTPAARDLAVPHLSANATPATYAAMGAMAMMLLMLAGYILAWALWWLRRR